MAKIIESREEIENTFDIKYIDSIEPSSPLVLEKVKKRAKRKLLPSYGKKHNKWISSLYASSLKKKKEAPFFLKQVNPLIGYGVFAKQNIPELGYIGEYAGTLRARTRKDKGNDYIFGYMVGFFRAPWIIDAKQKGNFTRFINHSFYPNVCSRGFVVDGVYHVVFFANKSIKKGEQLTYDYGPSYWATRPYPQDL